MDDKTFRAVLDWFMASDPMPVGTEAALRIQAWLNAESAARGYGSWITAFHYHGRQ